MGIYGLLADINHHWKAWFLQDNNIVPTDGIHHAEHHQKGVKAFMRYMGGE